MAFVNIVTLNIGAASKERAQRILDEWVKSSEFDIYVFTEVSDGDGTNLILAAFHDVNWTVVRVPCATNDRGVAIASRVGIKTDAVYPANDPGKGRAAIAVLDTTPQVELIGMYVPNRGNDPTKMDRKKAYLDCWLKQLSAKHNRQPCRILIGDLNIVPPAQHPNLLPQLPFEYSWYRDVIEKCGLYDAPVRHNANAHEDTWVAASGEGYTYDHVFIDLRLAGRVRGFRYDHNTRRRGGITDHSAVAVRLEMDSVSELDTYAVGTPRQSALF